MDPPMELAGRLHAATQQATLMDRALNTVELSGSYNITEDIDI
jgi:hypothetical protein